MFNVAEKLGGSRPRSQGAPARLSRLFNNAPLFRLVRNVPFLAVVVALLALLLLWLLSQLLPLLFSGCGLSKRLI